MDVREPPAKMSRARRGLVLLLLSAVAATSLHAGAAVAWNQWRGPARDGSVPGDDWPADLGGLERQWRIELGKGYPGPIVAGDRVFVVETVDSKSVAVRALDRRSGETIWERSWPGRGSVPFFAQANGDWVRSTPAYDGRALYVGDMSEVLVALDGESGKEIWRVDLPARFGTDVPDFGFASSPLLLGDHLYAQAANSLVKLDKRTGATVWRALEDPGRIQQSGAFSSPVAAVIDGVPQIVTLTREALYGVNPETGGVFWSQPVPSFRGMHIMTPVVVDGAIFTSPYKQRSFLYDVRRDGSKMLVEQAWENKSTGYMSSPVVIDGHLYLHLGNQRFECIELATGKSRWRSRPFGKYWSMGYQADKILALDSNGTLLLIRANPQAFELLDSREVSEQETWGHIAVSGDQIFVRELKAISAFRWRPSTRE